MALVNKDRLQTSPQTSIYIFNILPIHPFEFLMKPEENLFPNRNFALGTEPFSDYIVRYNPWNLYVLWRVQLSSTIT